MELMTWLKKIVHTLSPRCQEAIRRQSEAMDHPLPPLQRLGLRIHLVLCIHCLRYSKHMLVLRTAAQHGEPAAGAKDALPDDARKRIKQALKTGGKPPQ